MFHSIIPRLTIQTMDAKLSPTGGYSTFYAQTGNVRNRGVELSLGYKNTWNKFSWSSNYTFSANKNKILSLIDGYINPVTGEEITKRPYGCRWFIKGTVHSKSRWIFR